MLELLGQALLGLKLLGQALLGLELLGQALLGLERLALLRAWPSRAQLVARAWPSRAQLVAVAPRAACYFSRLYQLRKALFLSRVRLCQSRNHFTQEKQVKQRVEHVTQSSASRKSVSNGIALLE